MLLEKIRNFIFIITIAICAVLIPQESSANPVSSVLYVHNLILTAKNVNLTISPTVTPKSINSMSYMMKQIDAANLKLNGIATEYETGLVLERKHLVSKVRADKDINELIVAHPSWEFGISNTNKFDFSLSASGTYAVDWGDGTIDVIKKTSTTAQIISHNYSAVKNYTIKIAGKTTGYNVDSTLATLSFNNSTNKVALTSITGGLGRLFPTLGGAQPSFSYIFAEATGLKGTIPADLFTGITGAPVGHMFRSLFFGCTGLTGAIPAGLFSGITGVPALYMFDNTFSKCAGLTSIPVGLFAGINGAPAASMFASTFNGCSGLTGPIPAGLFGKFSGKPANDIFRATFHECSGLTGVIPAGLFSGISGAPAYAMFTYTFNGCIGLTGSIPVGLFSGISGAPASGMFARTFDGCAGLTGAIPAGLFSKITGPVAESMFNRTFSKCSGLTGSIPAGLFGALSGAPASYIFFQTFVECSGITGIDAGIWNLTGISGPMASGEFSSTFAYMTGLKSGTVTPTIALGSTVKLWQKFPAPTYNQQAFRGSTTFADYAQIPDSWK